MESKEIEGLDELYRAISERKEIERKNAMAWQRERIPDYGGLRRAEERVNQLKRKYPKAEAYIRYENMSLSSNIEHSIIGRQAMTMLENGTVVEKAEEFVSRKKDELINKHIWD